ncbi:MAG: TlpA family protein disulfide reductase [Candidatus Cloacimonetes bacterium]|nr:TlpA family protein disulfide reductase [Candidatus Cloacimonadota bacterium]
MKKILMIVAMLVGSISALQAMDVTEQVGQRFVDFSLYDINGEIVESDVHRKDKIVVMKIGQLSCPICSEVLSTLGKIDKEYQKKGVAFIDVTFDEDVSELKKHADEYDVDFPTLIDGNGDLATYYDINPIPVTIFASKEGKIIRYVIGRLSEEEIRNTLDEALK